jgi:hypothetical protein
MTEVIPRPPRSLLGLDGREAERLAAILGFSRPLEPTYNRHA